jgi:CrcB protein
MGLAATAARLMAPTVVSLCEVSDDGGGRQLDVGVGLPIDPEADDPADALDPSSRKPAAALVVAAVACGGVLGALARYGVAQVLPTLPGRFPWGTFWINVSGSVAIGFVLVLLLVRFPKGRLARPLVATGVIGAYTTFSTYVVDADQLLRAHDVATAAEYALGSLFAGLAAVAAGMGAARGVLRVEAVLAARSET